MLCSIYRRFVGTFFQGINLTIFYIVKILIGYFYFLVLEIGRLIARLITLQQIGFIKLRSFRYTINFRC